MLYVEVRKEIRQDSEKLNPTIEKNLAAGAAFSRDCACKAPTRPDQKFTSGEFQKQYEIVIASTKSCSEMDCRS